MFQVLVFGKKTWAWGRFGYFYANLRLKKGKKK